MSSCSNSSMADADFSKRACRLLIRRKRVRDEMNRCLRSTNWLCEEDT